MTQKERRSCYRTKSSVTAPFWSRDGGFPPAPPAFLRQGNVHDSERNVVHKVDVGFENIIAERLEVSPLKYELAILHNRNDLPVCTDSICADIVRAKHNIHMVGRNVDITRFSFRCIPGINALYIAREAHP